MPLFISTYRSFGGPLVVSTLLATSSTHLPVVVGGSCSGVTRSESSTFPNLNKAFVVGPGYAPVPYQLVSKITAGLFVDLADLLPDNIRAQEIEPQAFLDGETGGIRVQEMGQLDSSLHNLFHDSLPHLPLSLERFKPIQVAHYSDSKAFLTSRGSTMISASEKKQQPQVQPTGLACTQTYTIFTPDLRLPLQLLLAPPLPLPCR